MKIRFALMMLIGVFCAPMTIADDSAKLDAILEELRQLKQRVGKLEDQLSAVSPRQATPKVTVIPVERAQWGVFHPGRRFQNVRPMASRDVENVLRLQIESPGTLLKGIHERERQLRERIFLPEMH